MKTSFPLACPKLIHPHADRRAEAKHRIDRSAALAERDFFRRWVRLQWFALGILLLVAAVPGVCASPLLSSNQLVFVNVDHAPMGVCSTFAYGHRGQPCGIGTSSGVYPYYSDNGGGVLIGLSGNTGLRILPFVASPSRISTNAVFFPDAAIQRKLGPCTDEYNISGTGLSFNHYTPAWSMPDLDTATPGERKRFFLPAT